MAELEAGLRGLLPGEQAQTFARSGLARSDATRSGYEGGLSGSIRAWLYALSNVARSGATRSNYLPGLPQIMIGGVRTGPGTARRVLVASLAVQDLLNETPNTCTFTVLGQAPPVGASIVITFGSINNGARLFAGTVLRVQQIYVAQKPVNLQYQVEGIDWTWALNARLVTARYQSQSASTIAADLLARFAPAGYTGAIAAGLPVLDEISFTHVPLMDAFTQLAGRIGGYAVCDYQKVVRLWVQDNPQLPPPRALTASHPTLLSVSSSTDLSQVVTRALVEGGGVNALVEVAPGETRIPLEDVAWYVPTGGLVVSGPQRIRYTGVVTGGGSMVLVGGAAGNTAPATGPVLTVQAGGPLSGVYKYAYTWVTPSGESLPSPATTATTGTFANPETTPTVSTVAGTALPAGTYQYAYTWVTAAGETIPSPKVAFVVGALPDPSSTPSITAVAGPSLPSGRYRYGYTFVTGSGETLLSPTRDFQAGATTTPNPTAMPTLDLQTGAGLPNGSYRYAVTFVTATGETTIGPYRSITTTSSSTSDTVPSPGPPDVAFTSDATGISGYYYYKITYLTAEGETTPGLSDGGYVIGVSAMLTNIPRGTSYPRVTGRRIYRTKSPGTTYYLLATLNDTTTTSYGPDKTPDINLGGSAPTSNTTTITTTTYQQQVLVTNVQIGGAGVTGRKVYRSAKGSTTLKYLTTINDNVTTALPPDTVPDTNLGATPPTSNSAIVEQQALVGFPIGPGGTTARKVYRSVVNGTTLKLLTTVSNNTATSLASGDTTGDGSLGATAPTVNTSAVNAQAQVGGIAVGPSGVTQRKVYRTVVNGATLQLHTTLSNNTATSLSSPDTKSDATLGATAPTVTTAVLGQVQVVGITAGPGLTNTRRVYRTAANATQLKLLATLANNTATTLPAVDTAADATLGANVPTSDTSGLAGGAITGQVLAGSTTIPVSSVAPFEPEGWAQIDTQIIRYRGVSATELTGVPSTGVGSLEVTVPYNSPIFVLPQLIGIPASGTGAIVIPILQGDAVNLLVVVDDLAAQAALAALMGGDGVIEDYQQDNRISVTEATSRAHATLQLKRDPRVTVRYTTQDPTTRSGASITVDLPAPTNLVGTYRIQDVTVAGFLGTARYPTFEAVASSTRFTFEDLLRQQRKREG